jgi:hypothetical protein
MARRLFDFKCIKGHITESFVDENIREVKCSCCTESALRVISPVGIKLEPFTGIFTSSADRWERVRAEKLKQERKQNAE